jgi:hypothetical protein
LNFQISSFVASFGTETRALTFSQAFQIFGIQMNFKLVSSFEVVAILRRIHVKRLSKHNFCTAQPMETNPFQVLLTEISEELTGNEWRNCANRFTIPKAKKETFKQGFDFFWWLYEQNGISPGNLSLLKGVLSTAKRKDLIKFIEKYEGKSNFIIAFKQQ